MTEQLLALLRAKYPLQAKDPGEFSRLKLKGMRFTLQCWEAEGLGHVSLMQAKGFFGLMKLDTLIVNPTQRDLPLYSYDRIYAMGNDTLIAELYDSCVSPFDASALDRVCAEGKALPERDPGTHWYDGLRLPQSLSKRGKAGQRAAFDRLALAHFSAWLNSNCPPLTDRAAKAARTSAYVEGLLEHGGPSTDVFKQALGPERSARLFRRVLFGTA